MKRLSSSHRTKTKGVAVASEKGSSIRGKTSGNGKTKVLSKTVAQSKTVTIKAHTVAMKAPTEAPQVKGKASSLVSQSPAKNASSVVANVPAKAGMASSKSKSSSMRGLTASQLRELESRLKALAIEFKEALETKASTFNTGEDHESLIKGDDAEVAEKQRMSNAALQELDFLKGRLRLVARALAKLESGAYGFCEETEEPIGYERLSVVPWARFCVHVQEVHERKMRDFKVNRLRSEA